MTSSPLARLWSHAVSALQRLRASLLPLDTLLAKELHELRTNLRALETYCRRVALTEALGLHLGPRVFRPALKPAPGGPEGPRSKAKRHPTLRLWPRPGRMPVRVVLLGPPTSMREIWRDQRRTALIDRLRAGRWKRKPAHVKLADRIDALQRLLDAPGAAIARLARKLRLTPKLAFKIAARRAPASPILATEHADECDRAMWPLVLNSS